MSAANRPRRHDFVPWLAALLGNRLARLALFAIAPLLVMLWWQMGGAPGEVETQGEASGVVSEVYKHAYLVSLDDGGRVRVFRNRKLDKGARVTLKVRRYDNGNRHYVLPAEEPSTASTKH